MIDSGAITAVLHDLWHFVRNGFNYVPEQDKSVFAPVTLKTGHEYHWSDSETARIRLLLTEAYSDIDVVRSLQPSEYVAFVLREHDVQVPSDAKHWLAGYWHQKLKGTSGVHVSVVPTTGSVMEYFDENQDGVIGFVISVDDEESITFGSVGLYHAGVYEEHHIPKTVWHELRPVFTSFTSYDHK